MKIKILCPVHREGWLFVAMFALGAAIGFMLNVHLGWIMLILTAWCAYFFRDPVRFVPNRPGLVISPADGIVQSITLAAPPEELKLPNVLRTRISIFMNVFDVHINRAPTDVTVKQMEYVPGKFINASLDKASKDNERQIYLLSLPDGRDIIMVQIAGLVARRILRWVNPGDSVKTGQRIGMIRFGSRVDVYLPDGVNPMVCEGQRMFAGETVLADFKSNESSRIGRGI